MRVVLLLPRPLEGFILREQAEDLLREPGVVAFGPGRVPARVQARPGFAQARAAALRARLGGASPEVVVIFHPLQLPVAEALLKGGELWYGRWDRYEAAHDAGPALRRRLSGLHARAAARSSLTFAASDALAALGPGDAVTVGLSAGTFPAPASDGAVIAISLGHLGRRVDWRLLREVVDGMPELTVLLIGEDHPDELRGDADHSWCRSSSQLVWLGRRTDEEAARLIGCADVGIVPFRAEPFNDAGLPFRILKVARQGRRSVTPELAGVLTWERAVLRAPDSASWIAALRSQAGVRTAPDDELRAWALEQTAERVNAPLRERLRALDAPHAPNAGSTGIR